MAQRTINIGAAANDGTGDKLRIAGDKINDNFTEVYADVAGKAAASHTHATSEVTGLDAALASKVDDSQLSAFGATLINDADASAARTTLGLGTAAVLSTADIDERARDAVAAMTADSATIDVTYDDGADTIALDVIRAALKPTETILIAVGDETTAITTGTAKIKFRMPYAFTVTAVKASLGTTSSSGIPTVDINETGTTILSTKLTIDAGETTSTTAATAAVISDASLADDAEMTIDIDVAGTGAAGLKVYLIGYRT
ncbi:MAG: hypothetical protein V4657_09500 [Pseudomonadota bacterium]